MFLTQGILFLDTFPIKWSPLQYSRDFVVFIVSRQFNCPLNFQFKIRKSEKENATLFSKDSWKSNSSEISYTCDTDFASFPSTRPVSPPRPSWGVCCSFTFHQFSFFCAIADLWEAPDVPFTFSFLHEKKFCFLVIFLVDRTTCAPASFLQPVGGRKKFFKFKNLCMVIVDTEGYSDL